MKEPQKISTYINLIKQIEKWNPASMTGFEDLPQYVQNIIIELDAAISNGINEVQ